MNKTTRFIHTLRLPGMVLLHRAGGSCIVVLLPCIYNDLEPCSQGVRLRFVYDYNMEYANAFHSQVDCLALLVYDEQGNYLSYLYRYR